MIAFWFTAILLVLYIFHVIYVFHKIPWIKIEFYFCAGATLFLMLSSALIAAKGVGLFTAAAVSVLKSKQIQRRFCFFFFFLESIVLISFIYLISLLFSVLWICGNVCVRLWCILEIPTVQCCHYERCYANHYSYSGIKYLRFIASSWIEYKAVFCRWTAWNHTKKKKKILEEVF